MNGMWHDSRPPKPFYRRAWFIALAVLSLFGLLLAVAGVVYLKVEYGTRADALDLSKLDDMETASIVYDRNEKILGKIYIQNRDTIPLREMAGDLVPALIAAEDNRFFQHSGIDYIGIARAIIKDLRAGKVRQGASTITQQLARNSFAEALPSDRSFRRKILEAFVARRIESHYSKAQILEFYFNRVYFGSGFYGVEAAAHGYFGKSASDLTLSECATLTGMLRSPNNLSPWRNRKASIAARDFVLGRMLENDLIKQDRYEATLKEDLAVKNRAAIYSESYAVEFVRQQVANLIGSNDSVYGDGYRIYTTIDGDLQKTAEKTLRTRLEEVEQRRDFGTQRQTYAQYEQMYRQRRKRADNDPLPGPSYLQGALYALDNRTGGVLALVGGRNFAHNQFNRALLSNRPPGTAFLPLVYAAGFEKGIFPGSVFQDAVMDNRQVMIGGTTGVLGEWGPERVDNHFEGPISAHYALVKSKNAATVRLGMTTGVDAVLDLAKRAGIDSELRRYPATFLGSSEVTLEDLTLSFSMFPNGGVRPAKPFVIQRVVQKDGQVIFEQPQRKPVQVVQASTAYEVHSALADSLEWGSADKAFSSYGLRKFPLGGKTGTAYNFTDVWFVGYSSAVTCGVWAGFDSPQAIYRGGFSNEIALPIWVDFMNASFAHFPAEGIARPDALKKYEICRDSGMLATDKCFETTTGGEGETFENKTTYFEWGTPEQAPEDPCDVHGEPGGRRVKVAKPSGEGTRAELAVDLETFVPTPMKAPTVLGDDPFGAIRSVPVRRAEAVGPDDPREIPPTDPQSTPVEAAAQTEEPKPEEPGEPPIRRAEKVRTLDIPDEQSTIQLDAPPAIQF